MEIKCKRTYSKTHGILTSCEVKEPDGTVRKIGPLFSGQMIRDYKGRSFYRSSVPENYFDKAERLEADGWYRWYHFDSWVHTSLGNPEHISYTTDEAINMLEAAEWLANKKRSNHGSRP